jgi:hypothetical protein
LDAFELGSALRRDHLEDRVLVGPEVIQEMEDQMKKIRQRIKEAQDRQKSYADARRVEHSYKFGDRVFLGEKPCKSSIKFGCNILLLRALSELIL